MALLPEHELETVRPLTSDGIAAGSTGSRDVLGAAALVQAIRKGSDSKLGNLSQAFHMIPVQ